MKIINALNDYMYVYEDGKVVKKELTKEKGVITSFLTPKDIFSLTKKFDKTSTKEDMIIEMEKYIFSYPNIDVNKEYEIVHLFIERENKTIVEALLIDNESLNAKFKKIRELYKYIDFISPSFLAWQEYYNLTKTEPKNDVFIYFDEDEGYLSVFSNGKYLFHKSLNKLSTLCKITNKSLEEILEILSQKGLDRSKYEDEELFFQIDKFFSEFFLKIFNQLNYSINEYEIAKYDRIFFYSPFKINYLFEQYTNYWDLNGIEFKPLALNTEYNNLEYLITFFNADNYENEEINFSVFIKPPLFIKTPAGIFISYIFVLFFLLSGYFFNEYFYIKRLKSDIFLLEKKYFLLEKRNRENLKILDKLKSKLSNILKQYKEVHEKIDDFSKKIDILSKKNKLPLEYNVFVKLTKFLEKYNLKLKSINKKGTFYTLTIISSFNNTHEIASFMQDLLNNNFNNVSSKTIKVNKNKYISYVEFEYE